MVCGVNCSNPNPKLSANILSKLTFSWLIPLFWYGRKNDLEAKDVYDVLPENDSAYVGEMLGRSWQDEMERAKKRQCQPSLFTAVAKTFFWPIVRYALLFALGQILTSVIQPMAIDLYIKHFNAKDSIFNGVGSATIIVLTNLAMTHAITHSHFKNQELGMQAKIACSSLIYRKMTRLSCATMAQIEEGHIINLLANDVVKWERFFSYVHFGWLIPLKLLAVVYIMLGKAETAVLVGISVFALQIVPVQGIFNRIIYKFRLQAALVTDRRILLIKEIFNGIKVIKMYNWEKPFEKFVLSLRKREIKWLKWLAYTKGISNSITAIIGHDTLFATILAHFILEGRLMESENIFSIWRYFVVLQMIILFLPYTIYSTSEARAAVKRIEKFLLLEEMQNTNHYYSKDDDTNNPSVSIRGVSVSWCSDSIINILSDINVEMHDKQLYMIVGPAGGGKSSLLKLILGELQPNAGTVSIYGKVSYSSQDPWLFSGSIKNNILFGEPYDEIRYKKVTSACALTEDFNQLPYGDKTLVGNGGSVLSGGQRARINLARALYRKADIYLLDNCLSAVDISVGKELYHKCFKDFLKEQTCILVTHNFQYTNDEDNLILIDKGTIPYQGTFGNFKKCDQYSQYLIEQVNCTKENEKVPKYKILATEENSDDPIRMNFEGKEDEEPSETDELLGQADEPRETEELMVKGKIATSLYWKYFKSGGSYWKLSIIAITVLLTQVFLSLTDLHILYISKINKVNFSIFTNESEAISEKIYSETNDETHAAFYKYGILVTASIVTIFVRSLMFFSFCMDANKNIHNKMFVRLLRAPLSFFYVNNIGRIINRFSQDTGSIDDNLVELLLNAIQTVVLLLAYLLVICMVKWWIIFPAILGIIIFINILLIYQSTARDIRRLEGIAKGPVFSHVDSIFTGLLTVRSCQLQGLVYEEFTQLQNHHTSAYYLVIAGIVITKYWIATLKNVFTAFLCYGFLFTNSSSSDVNFIFTKVMFVITILIQLIRWFAEILIRMVNVERMFQFTEVEQESPPENHSVEAFNSWPNSGRVQFDHLYLKYFDTTRSVLRNINFSIEAGQKIGIVGRTGAGKSTLIASLFRLVDFDGSIYIDNEDIKKRDVHDVRSKISIIPQDSLLFTLSLRENLDPNKDYSDQTIWSALKDVGLDHMFTSLNVLLDKKQLSIGKIQLLSLARVILKKNQIVVLDEATANVDNETNISVQTIIKNKFKDCTLISVAHRLNTVIDSDKVLVMDNGQILEFDHPYVLLRKEGGAFQRMALQSNDAAYENLKRTAKDAWLKKQKCS